MDTGGMQCQLPGIIRTVGNHSNVPLSAADTMPAWGQPNDELEDGIRGLAAWRALVCVLQHLPAASGLLALSQCHALKGPTCFCT